MGEDTPSSAAKPSAMLVSTLRWSRVVAGTLAVGLASCSGNLGSGSGLTIPQTQSFGQPNAPGQAGYQSRQRSLDGAVAMNADLAEIPLPSLGGFSVAIELGTPGPSPSPSSSASPATSNGPSARPRRTPLANAMPHLRAVEDAASPTAAASPSPSPVASGSPSPGPSGSASPAASGKPSAAPSGKASAKPSATSRPKIVTKTTIYPEDAPAAPTPEPSGDVQTFFKRQAIVRGYFQPPSDVSLYGLGAVRFTIPSEEETVGRGFTIALFEAGKKHHEKLLVSDAQPKLDNDVVASTIANAPIALKKGQAYIVVLYGDEQPSTPGPVPPGYPQPGTNPFVTPAPPGYPQPGQPGYPSQPGQPYPYPTQTPFGTYPTQTPHP